MREVLSVMAAIMLLWPTAAAAEDYNTADTVGWTSKADSESDAAKPAIGVGTPDASKGAYKQLSPGNQQIAEALFNSQIVGVGTRQAWSLDRIAATKQNGVGWGHVFQRMQAEGLIKERNLGNVLADSRRPAMHLAPQRPTVIVTGAGKVYVAGGGRGGKSSSGLGRYGERALAERDDRAKTGAQIAQRPQKRPQGDGRGWIAAGGGRSGSPSLGVATASSSSHALHRGSLR
jgi:hypothetical protein